MRRGSLPLLYLGGQDPSRAFGPIETGMMTKRGTLRAPYTHKPCMGTQSRFPSAYFRPTSEGTTGGRGKAASQNVSMLVG